MSAPASPVDCLLATGHELAGLDGLGLLVAIGLFLCVGFALLVIVLVVTGVRRRKKHTRPPAPPGERARGRRS